MRKSFGIRISEVIYGLLLVDKAVRNAPLESKFRVTLDTLSMSIVVGVMLSHKISTDKPFSNESWAHIFNASLSDVASSEIVLLKALNFDVSLDEKEMKFLELFLDK
ncbi:uncharacterized protein MONOS_18129 [Monocercomonoides exilis]|uniref:uncharacterized protein n=1 Tax=Monocercomonoides exilis TaxID=2049356 RepID=UPI00355A1DC7|nr:hypothetical protein MONOS_18129 [Monocercomonoides exilis]